MDLIHIHEPTCLSCFLVQRCCNSALFLSFNSWFDWWNQGGETYLSLTSRSWSKVTTFHRREAGRGMPAVIALEQRLSLFHLTIFTWSSFSEIYEQVAEGRETNKRTQHDIVLFRELQRIHSRGKKISNFIMIIIIWGRGKAGVRARWTLRSNSLASKDVRVIRWDYRKILKHKSGVAIEGKFCLSWVCC